MRTILLSKRTLHISEEKQKTNHITQCSWRLKPAMCFWSRRKREGRTLQPFAVYADIAYKCLAQWLNWESKACTQHWYDLNACDECISDELINTEGSTGIPGRCIVVIVKNSHKTRREHSIVIIAWRHDQRDDQCTNTVKMRSIKKIKKWKTN